MSPALPLAARNRLAGVILSALRDARARQELAALAGAPEDTLAGEWLEADDRGHADALRARARRADVALAALPLEGREGSLAEALTEAAALFDAGLYFEVHELLEPWWRESHGGIRETLQGLVQIAVGYQHLANGNSAGARALLGEGSARLHGRSLEGLALDAFAREVARSIDRLAEFDWDVVPRFPRRGAHAP